MPGHDAGPAADGRERGLADRRVDAAHVHGDARRLGLEPDAAVLPRDRLQLGEQPAVELVELGREALDEAEVELGAVAPDEVHLAREPRERRQVAQRPAGDHRDDGLRQRRERADARRPPPGSGPAAAGSSTSGASVPS